MFVRVRTGGVNVGKVLSVHRGYQAANTASGTKVFETILNVGEERYKVGDVIPDWQDRWHLMMKKLRGEI